MIGLYQFKVKHPVKDEASGQIKKETIIGLCPAVCYTEAEAVANNLLEKLAITDFVIKGITQAISYQVLADTRPLEREDDMFWFKSRIRYETIKDSGKVEVTYEYFLVYEEDIHAAAARVKRQMDGTMADGSIDQVMRTEITHMVYIDSDSEFLSNGNTEAALLGEEGIDVKWSGSSQEAITENDKTNGEAGPTRPPRPEGVQAS